MSLQDVTALQQRIVETVDQTALLLDRIYKFPQKQRQHFYQRIQSLKQNLSLLKAHMKQSNLLQCDKRYQQLFLQYTALKNQITVCFNDNSHKATQNINNKKKEQLLAYLSQKQNNFANSKQNKNQYGYDQIMGTIVQKEQQCGQLKQRNSGLERELQRYKNNNQNFVKQIQEFKLHLKQLNSINVQLENENQILKSEVKYLQTESIKLQSMFRTHRQQLQFHKYENNKLNEALTNISEELKLKMHEVQSYKVTISSMQQKHGYELKEVINKYEHIDARDKKGDKMIEELREELNKMREIQQQYANIKHENKRLREDIDIVSEQLQRSKQSEIENRKLIEKLVEDKGKFEQEKHQLNIRIEQLENSIQFYVDSRESDRSAVQLEFKRIYRSKQGQYQGIIGKLQEQIINLNSNIKQIQKQYQNIMELDTNKYVRQIKEMEHALKVKEEDYRTISLQNRELMGENDKIRHQFNIFKQQKAKQQMHKNQKRQKQKIQEKDRIIQRIKAQNMQILLQFKNYRKDNQKKQRESQQKQRQILNLKKKILRAKIQTVHDIREVIA